MKRMPSERSLAVENSHEISFIDPFFHSPSRTLDPFVIQQSNAINKLSTWNFYSVIGASMPYFLFVSSIESIHVCCNWRRAQSDKNALWWMRGVNVLCKRWICWWNFTSVGEFSVERARLIKVNGTRDENYCEIRRRYNLICDAFKSVDGDGNEWANTFFLMYTHRFACDEFQKWPRHKIRCEFRRRKFPRRKFTLWPFVTYFSTFMLNILEYFSITCT